MTLSFQVALGIAAMLGISALPAWGNALRVCADPDYFPYSNRAGEGFENKIADAVARALGTTVDYTWASYRGEGGFPQFLATTLDAKKCDVVMNVPYGTPEESTTQPYYTSSYVFIFKKASNYNIRSMDSPALKQLRIGFEDDTPAEDAVKFRGLYPKSVQFQVGTDRDQKPADMLQALRNRRIDVLITWEPTIGAFLAKYPDFEVVTVPNDRALGPPEQFTFPIAMAVRKDDDALKKSLDEVIAKHGAELTSILNRYGVKSYLPKDPNAP